MDPHVYLVYCRLLSKLSDKFHRSLYVNFMCINKAAEARKNFIFEDYNKWKKTNIISLEEFLKRYKIEEKNGKQD